MKKLLIGVTVLVIIVVAAAIAAPFLIPLDAYKARLAAAVKSATGRDLAIDGPVRLSLLPSLGVEAHDVALANTPGGTSADMVRLSRLEVGLKLFPILSGEVAIDRLVLVNPVITLEIDRQGRPNWVFAGPAAVPQPLQAQPVQASAGAGGAALGLMSGLRLPDLRLENGRISYLDRRNGSRSEITGIDLKLALPSIDAPLIVDGTARWKEKPVTLALKLAAPRDFLQGKSSPVGLKLAAPPIDLTFTGTLAAIDRTKLDGDVTLTAPSLRVLAAWAGTAIATTGGGLGAFSLKGKLSFDGAKASLSNAALSLDDIKATGELAIETGGATPALRGKLALDRLDLNPYLPPDPSGNASGDAKPAAPTAASTGGWSDAPLGFGALRLVNAELQLSAGGIQYRRIAIGGSTLAIALKDGHLAADLPQLSFYQGSGQGKLTIDAAQSVVSLSLKLANVQAEPLLRDALDLGRISGTGAFDVTLSARGTSERGLISTLAGKGAVGLKNGAIKGLDLGAMARNVTTAFTDSAAAQTAFSQLGGSFTIANGVLTNKDFALQSPALRADGAGTIDLPRRSIDYRLTPKLAAAPGLPGLAVAVVIRGPLDHPSYQPDLAGVVKEQAADPTKLMDTMQPGPKPTNLLKGLLGGGAKSPP